MSTNQDDKPKDEQAANRGENKAVAGKARRYHPPTLRRFGEVRTLTLAPSPITQIESGEGFDFGRSSFP